MADLMSKEMELSVVKLVNYGLDGDTLPLEEYQRIDFYLYDQTVVNSIIKLCKFKDIGNIYDFPEELPQPDSVGGSDLLGNYDLFQRLYVSKKFNAVAFINAGLYSICCTFLVDIDNLKKFSKRTKDIVQQDTRASIFSNIDFECASNEYVEISDSVGDTTKPVEVLKKKVNEEHLVFDDSSVIIGVMNDIARFFKKETKDLYDKLELAYKRGIILFGDPGNGKSAMIREIIRKVPEVSKVIINPNVPIVTRILSSLTKALNGKKALIIIEDIDSLITDANRSEFLNILDGVDIKSGIYFIGTTNYPERIDPAFMNRSGRFDRTFKIDNPSEATRRAFFESRKIGKLLSEYKVFKDDSKPDTNEGVVELFVVNSNDLPMASLKELITSTSYILASNTDMSVEEAVTTASQTLKSNRQEHMNSHMTFKQAKRRHDDDYGEL